MATLAFAWTGVIDGVQPRTVLHEAARGAVFAVRIGSVLPWCRGSLVMDGPWCMDTSAINSRLAVRLPARCSQEASLYLQHSRKEVRTPSFQFTGLLEMGGASLQVTFLPSPTAKLPEKLQGLHLKLPGVAQRPGGPRGVGGIARDRRVEGAAGLSIGLAGRELVRARCSRSGAHV